MQTVTVTARERRSRVIKIPIGRRDAKVVRLGGFRGEAVAVGEGRGLIPSMH
jgi:hypothetical protein